MGRGVFRKNPRPGFRFPFAIFVSFVVPAVPSFCSPYVFIRVHLRLKRSEKPKMAGLGAENRDFGSKMGRKRRFQAVFGHFSPARPVAARFR